MLFGDRCFQEGVLTEIDVKNIQTTAHDLVEDAVAFAEASPEPPAEWLMTGVVQE